MVIRTILAAATLWYNTNSSELADCKERIRGPRQANFLYQMIEIGAGF